MSDTLERTLGLKELLFIVIGTVIGSGIFLVPGAVLRQTGGFVGVALLVWLLGGILSLLGALTYGELGAMDPKAGGLYVYLRDAFGPGLAFVYGWTQFFVIGGGSNATLAVAAPEYLDKLIPIGVVGRKLVSIALLTIVAIINIRGTRQSANVQNVTTIIKVGALLVMSVILIGAGHGFAEASGRWWPDSLNLQVFSGIGLGLIGVLWAYEGWTYVTFSAGEAKDPQRTFPRGLVLGSSALIFIYVFAVVGYIAALGPERLAASSRVAADAVGAIIGPVAANLIAVAILISIFSALNGLALTAPRVYFAMARDRVFFQRLAEIHPRFGTPAFSIITSTVWSMVLALTGTFEQLLTYVVFVGWIFYGLGAIAVPVFRRTRPDVPRSFRVPGYPITPLLFVLAALGIVLNTVVSQPGRAGIGIAVVLTGVPAYFIWRRKAAAP